VRHSLHEHVDNVAQDGASGQQHHDAEHKRADGVGQVPARVVLVGPDQRAGNGHADALQQVPDHVQHGAAQVDALATLPAALLAVRVVTGAMAVPVVVLVLVAAAVAACRGCRCCLTRAAAARQWAARACG
jgi:hypothetical protein